MKIELVQSGQDRKYGDYYYKYKIETSNDAEIETIFEKIKEQFGSNHTNAIPELQYRKEDTNANNHFRNYYIFKKESYGYFLTITSPSTY